MDPTKWVRSPEDIYRIVVDAPAGVNELRIALRYITDQPSTTSFGHDCFSARNIGVISPEMAYDFGLTGPMLRGSGIDFDLRRDVPYMLYGEMHEQGAFDIPVASGEKGTLGDCWDRVYVRVMEMMESVKIVRWCLGNMVEGPVIADIPKVLRVPPGEAYVGIENPRGELGHYVVSDGGKVAVRCRVRGPSFTNLAVLEDMMPGTFLADSVAIVGSTDIVVGETDR